MFNFRGQGGYTLIIVLWSIVILTVIFSYLLDDVFLENYLIEGYSEQRKLRQTALSAYIIAINHLLNDDTIYDSLNDKWAEEIQGNLNGVNYIVDIRDIGSRLNINFDDFSILRELPTWSEEMETIIDDRLIPDPLFLREVLSEENYSVIIDNITTYGSFNINQDSPEELKRLFNFLDLNYLDTERIIENMKEYQEEERFTSLDELHIVIDGLETSTVDLLRDFLTSEGRININMVTEEILAAIVKGKELDLEICNKIIAYRQENDITSVEDLRNILSDEQYEKVRDGFTTQSHYLEININAFISEKRGLQIHCIINRVFQDGEWLVNILTWSEDDSFLE